MKTLLKPSQLICVLATVLFLIPTANGQILKKLQKKAEQTVERKLEQKTEKETGKAMDSILDPNEKSPNKDAPKNDDSSNDSDSSPSSDTKGNSDTTINNPNVSDDLEIYSKFDYVPGDKLLYFDDFSQDFIGDFPSKWNTNGSGEVIKLNKAEGNWFEFRPGYKIQYLPLLKINLPEEYTIEFDLLTDGLDNQTSSAAVLNIILDESKSFNIGKSYSSVSLPFGQLSALGIRVKSIKNGDLIINSVLTADVRDEVKNKPHISIAVNNRRFRLWINEVKYVDIPQLIADGNVLTTLKFNLHNFKDGKERLFIQNIKIAEGGLDLRRTLMTDGRVSTNGILFNSGSANIQPQSLGIVRQISQVLLQDESMKLNIVGHTDSDGSDDANLKLSKARAEAVKNALVEIYEISGDRLQTDGKGENTPVADNTSADGKAQNRRVEFIKI